MIKCRSSHETCTNRKTLKGGHLSETIDLTIKGFKNTVANQVVPTYMKASEDSLKWVASELYQNFRDLPSGRPTEADSKEDGHDPAAEVVLAPDSDDDEEDNVAAQFEIKRIKDEEPISTFKVGAVSWNLLMPANARGRILNIFLLGINVARS